mgnify:FL=1
MSFEDPLKQKNPEQIEEIALRAAEKQEFQEIVRDAPNKLEAIRSVREALPLHFPEIKELPEPQRGPQQRPIGLLVSNEFLIAKTIVELLFSKKER